MMEISNLQKYIKELESDRMELIDELDIQKEENRRIEQVGKKRQRQSDNSTHSFP